MAIEPAKKSFWTKFVDIVMPILLDNVAMVVLTGAGGFKLFILRLVVKYGRRELVEAVQVFMKHYDEAVKNSKVTEKYGEAVTQPEQSREERKDAESNFLNG